MGRHIVCLVQQENDKGAGYNIFLRDPFIHYCIKSSSAKKPKQVSLQAREVARKYNFTEMLKGFSTDESYNYLMQPDAGFSRHIFNRKQ